MEVAGFGLIVGVQVPLPLGLCRGAPLIPLLVVAPVGPILGWGPRAQRVVYLVVS